MTHKQTAMLADQCGLSVLAILLATLTPDKLNQQPNRQSVGASRNRSLNSCNFSQQDSLQPIGGQAIALRNTRLILYAQLLRVIPLADQAKLQTKARGGH